MQLDISFLTLESGQQYLRYSSTNLLYLFLIVCFGITKSLIPLKRLTYVKVFSSISAVQRACKELIRSKRLRSLLQIVLVLGNYMNRGQRGNAAGICSIPFPCHKLDDVTFPNKLRYEVPHLYKSIGDFLNINIPRSK